VLILRVRALAYHLSFLIHLFFIHIELIKIDFLSSHLTLSLSPSPPSYTWPSSSARGFAVEMCKWMLVAVPATYINSMLKYVLSRACLTFVSLLSTPLVIVARPSLFAVPITSI
jgi:hypothetical protein